MKVTNNITSPLVLPNGPAIMPQTTVLVPDWASKATSAVVKAWVEMGALTLTPISADEPANETDAGGGKLPVDETQHNLDLTGDQNGAGDQGGANAGSDEAGDEFRAMTNPELVDYITKNGGAVKAGMVKDDLVAIAIGLQKA